ncbi:hypothetical protein, partial [Escherichia coli]|uniref:hypothetical protein n=1 Tax=Escherichia coli TaxID=562 RepID=UPI001BC84896
GEKRERGRQRRADESREDKRGSEERRTEQAEGGKELKWRAGAEENKRQVERKEKKEGRKGKKKKRKK